MGPNQPTINDLQLDSLALAAKQTAGPGAIGQTLKAYTGKQALAVGSTTTVTLETVATGKTFYMTDILWGTDVTAGTQIVDAQLQAAGVTVFRQGVHSLAPINAGGLETQPSATSAQLVTIFLPALVSGTGNFWFFVSGYEQ